MLCADALPAFALLIVMPVVALFVVPLPEEVMLFALAGMPADPTLANI